MEPIFTVLQVSPSAYHDAKRPSPSARAERDAVLGPQLRGLWERNGAPIGQASRYSSKGAPVAAKPFILQPGEGRDIDLGGFLMTVKADADTTAGGFTLLEAAEPPHFGPPMHIHRDAAEAFYVLEGEYIIFIDEEETRCPAGSFVYIPPGAVHGFRVSDRPSRKLNVYVPQAMVGYFDELAHAVATGTADDATLAAIAERHGMEVLGPVPEGCL